VTSGDEIETHVQMLGLSSPSVTEKFNHVIVTIAQVTRQQLNSSQLSATI
jgi:hypothetical protein